MSGFTTLNPTYEDYPYRQLLRVGRTIDFSHGNGRVNAGEIRYVVNQSLRMLGAGGIEFGLVFNIDINAADKSRFRGAIHSR